MRIFVLGCGSTGGLLAQLLRRQGHKVWCGDRNPERARHFLDRRMVCLAANARNHRSIVEASRGCHLLVNTAPAVFNDTVIRAALRLNVHYLDMAAHLTPNPFKSEQLAYHGDFARRGRLALINAGVAPGLTNLLVARCASFLSSVDRVQIRLFEETESDDPISTWSGDVAYDEAISKPRIYRQGRFRLARRFGEAEWFRFPQPIGEVRVVLAAQDEVATLPYFINMNDLDVKIGGNEIDRLHRWYREGKLRPSRKRIARHFPDTVSPRVVAEMIRRGKLRNARFSVAVCVSGRKGRRFLERRRICLFPSLYKLRQMRLLATPIAFAAAQSAAVFVQNFPAHLDGVYPPEALSAEVRKCIMRDMRRRGFRFRRQTIVLGNGRPSVK
ncbi:MAG TPA: saccharopine dehydrogenase NADP-binding domain-containing protein [Verrucomicrobiae bacterium]|nr:saccharopine dehydrogenase NADP-binding domain-containing protein [Verrucomicrobiae bacterium]